MLGLDARAGQPGVVLPAEADGFRLVVDLGNGALGGLQRYTALNRVDAVALSHLHADHCLDMCPFWVARTYSDEGALPSIPVYGPAGAAERIARANDDPDVTGVFDFVTLTPGRHRIGPFAVTAGHVAHPIETFAFRFEHGGHVLTYSGDTSESPHSSSWPGRLTSCCAKRALPTCPIFPWPAPVRAAGRPARRPGRGRAADPDPPGPGQRPGAEPGRGGGHLQWTSVPRGPRPGIDLG